MKSLWTKRGQADEHYSALIACSFDVRQSRGHLFEVDRFVWSFFCVESVHVGVWISYHQLPGVIKKPGGAQYVFVRVWVSVHICIHTLEFNGGLSETSLYVCNSKLISSTNYRTLLPSNSLKWARRNWEIYSLQIKLCVLIVFMFVGLSTTSEGICCCLMYACCARGNVFYDHYYSNELEMCFESPKSLSMNGYPWRL